MRPLLRTSMALFLMLALSSAATAGELSGVKMPDKLPVAGQELVLNGMGLRKILIVKVYVAGLYVAAKTRDANAVLASAAPRAIRIELVRDVDKGRLTSGFKEGIEKNGGDRVAAHEKHMGEFVASFGDHKKGQVIQFADAAEGGLAISIDGKPVRIIGDRAFANLVFAIWLGPKPPTEDLKKGLLGG